MLKARSFAIAIVLLWLAGNAMRLPVLAVPPVIPALRNEFHLSGTEIGTLTGLPIVLFAAAALVGSLLVARLGAVGAVVAGLMLTALGSACRGMAPDLLTLLAATALMGAGVAVTQPAMPVLVGRWLPRHIALGTGIYTNGLLVGEILPVGLFPLLFSLSGGSWRATFVFWAVPIAVIALLVVAAAPRDGVERIVIPPRWWPNWPARDILRIGVLLAAASALYYATNAFLPGHLAQAGRSDIINPALTAFNFGQLPASLVLIGVGRLLERRAWPFVFAGALSLVCIALIVATANAVVVVASAGLFGFGIGTAFALCLTLPPLLSSPQEVARVSAAMFTIGYGGAMAVAVVSGALWDFTGVEPVAFLPIGLSALVLMLLAPTISFDRKSVVGTGAN